MTNLTLFRLNVQLHWRKSDGIFLVLASQLLLVGTSIVQFFFITLLGTFGLHGSTCLRIRVKFAGCIYTV